MAFLLSLPFLIIIAVFFIGVTVNVIKGDHVFKNYDKKH